MKRIFISTSIPYVNADPHLGHALEFVQADALARAYRLQNHDVFFVSGTDDNALKNVEAAERAGKEVEAFVREHATRFRELAEHLSVSNDYFIETSKDSGHREGAQKLWSEAKDEDIYKKNYKGLYCVGCEEFKSEKDLRDGECIEHPGKKLEEVEEENYFFKLSTYESELREKIGSNEINITPESRRNEVTSFISTGLQDFSISRSSERAKGWGVPVPGDEGQIQYVWFDALSNYINALGYAEDAERFERYWSGADKIIHCIGKGIIRFHALYWPAMLLSAGLRTPDQLFVHGYITIDGQKMSKSLGNVINPTDLINEYGSEALRYYLLRHVHPFEDSDITEAKFKEVYNAHLANGLGNVLSRIMKMYVDYGVEVAFNDPGKIWKDPEFEEYRELLLSFEFNLAADYLWEGVAGIDSFIAEKQPFKVVKEDEEKAKEMVAYLVLRLYDIAVLLKPIMPETSKQIVEVLTEKKIPEPLFKRVE